MKHLKKIAKELELPFVVKEGSRHTRVYVGDNVTHVPRHIEISDHLAQAIFDQARGLK